MLDYLIPLRFLPFVFLSFTVHAVAPLSDALSYMPEGRGFDSGRYHWNFSLT
jgi:hypothetical protein